jgi:hypothetical protein
MADLVWDCHVERLINEQAGPEDLVALFGLSFVVEQLESSWDLNTLCNLRSARTTLRSALEGLFQLTAVANSSNLKERRHRAIEILGQELSQKISRLQQIHDAGTEESFDASQLEAWESDVKQKSERFQSDFGLEPTRIPIEKLAEMGGIGGYFMAYMEDKMFAHTGLSQLEHEPNVRDSLQITHECCDFLLTALRAATHLLNEDMDDLLEPHDRRIRKLHAELDVLYPPE